MVKLEFAHYDNLGRGSMAPLDFARALVAAADLRQSDMLLDRVRAAHSKCHDGGQGLK